jgi:hypothetical protein
MTPVPKDGFEIRGTITQPAIGADWSLSANIIKTDLDAIDDPDETATFSASAKVPFNEAPDEASVTAKLQDLVDMIYDRYVPSS